MFNTHQSCGLNTRFPQSQADTPQPRTHLPMQSPVSPVNDTSNPSSKPKPSIPYAVVLRPNSKAIISTITFTLDPPC